MIFADLFVELYFVGILFGSLLSMIVHLLLQINGRKNIRTALFCVACALPVFIIYFMLEKFKLSLRHLSIHMDVLSNCLHDFYGFWAPVNVGNTACSDWGIRCPPSLVRCYGSNLYQKNRRITTVKSMAIFFFNLFICVHKYNHST